MRVLFVHTEQYKDWQNELLFTQIRQPIVACGAHLTAHDFVRNHRQKPIDLEAEGRALIGEIEKFEPNLIIYSQPWFDVPNKYLFEIRRRNIAILTVLWDTLVSPKPPELNIVGQSDYIAVCDSVSNYFRYRLLFDIFRAPRTGGVLFLSGLLVPQDVFIQRTLPKIHDVSVLGSAEGARHSLIEYLKVNLPSHIRFSKLGGLVNSAVGNPELGLTDGWIPPDEYIDAINQTKVLISTQTSSERVQVKGKVFEFMSCGGFCLIDRNWEYEKLIPEGCVSYFDSQEDLIEKITYYVSNDGEREKIAKRGQQWFRTEFNNRQFWLAFFEYISGNADRLPSVPMLEMEYHGRVANNAVKAKIRTGIMQAFLNLIRS
jgi:hypothetical protein